MFYEGFSSDFKCLFQMFLIKLFLDNHGKIILSSKNKTSYFQPLIVNQCCKTFPINKAQTWYLEQVSKQIIYDVTPD